MDKQQLLQLHAMLQRLVAMYNGVKRNPSVPQPADVADQIFAFVEDAIAQPGPLPGSNGRPSRGNM